MIVIHPDDPTTAFLMPLYEADGQTDLYTQAHSNAAIRHALNHKTYQGETVMMLGHGCEYGLLANSSPGRKFDRLIINSSHAQFLRGKQCIAIWCNADKFGAWYGLQGLFSGMIISEMEEARLYNIQTTPEEIAAENERLTRLVARALKETNYLSEVPDYIEMLAEPLETPLQQFNYRNFHYFGGKEK